MFHSDTYPLIQGPLAGYSAAPFRKLFWQYGAPAFCCSEMISAKDLRHRKDSARRFLYRDPIEAQLCYQLSGNDPDDLAFACDALNPYRPDYIDLNCGCPKPKIRKKHCGTKLLTDPERLYRLVLAMKNSTDAPISIKIRVSDPLNDHCDQAVVDAAQSAGVAFMTVHGRHWTERYDVPARIASIQKICQYASVPIIANGDADSADDILRYRTQTDCRGVMISRASVGRPWLFAQINAALQGTLFSPPSQIEVGEMFIEHLTALVQLDGEHLAVLQARKLAKYYAQSIENRTSFVLSVQTTRACADVFALIRQFFNSPDRVST